jgi:vacuolar-type H+-ATPase subunit H
MDIKFQIQNAKDMRSMTKRLQQLQSDVEKEIDAVAEEIALRIVADARRGVNVDTGRLRASIDFETETEGEFKASIRVGSNVEYAISQEFDNPYIRPAIEENRETITSLLEEAVAEAAEGNSA